MDDRKIKIEREEFDLFGLLLFGNGTLEDMRTTKEILDKVAEERIAPALDGWLSFSEKELSLILSVIDIRNKQGAIDIRSLPLIEKFLTEETE
jgi:hypothetical protein